MLTRRFFASTAKQAPTGDITCQIKLLSHNPYLLDIITSFARQSAQAITLSPTRSSPMSFSFSRYTVNKSPFAHGKHQDQFEVRTYERSFDIVDGNDEATKRWMHYLAANLPAGVGFEYTMHAYEPLKTENKAQS